MTRRLLATLAIVTISGSLPACSRTDGEKADDKAAPGSDKDKRPAGKAEVPSEVAPLALDEGGNAIPATIDAPKGSTIFADSPTMLRVEFGNGEGFGVQVKEGNEFNLDLEETAKGLAENKYGSTNEIIEKTDTLLRYTMTTDGRTSHKFTVILELASKKWICTQGNMGGWSEAQATAQLAVCKTLKAK